MKSPTKDEMVLRTEILLKVYNALKVDAKLHVPLEEALKKLNPDSAVKFTSEMSMYNQELMSRLRRLISSWYNIICGTFILI